MRWEPSRTVALLLLLGGLAFGAWVEAKTYNPHSVSLWLPDLLVGWTFFAAAWIAVHRGSTSAGALLAATGLTWFLGTLIPELVLLHRGPVMQLLITYPRWKPQSLVGAALVAISYLAAVWPGLLDREIPTLIGAVVVWVFLAAQAERSVGRQRRDRRTALAAGTPVLLVLMAGALVRIQFARLSLDQVWLFAYDLALGLLAVRLVAGLASTSAHTMTDLVVELGDSRSGTARDQLARALGDPQLILGFWSDDAADYVDDRGPIVLPPSGDLDRSTTTIDQDGRPFAVLVHDVAVHDEPLLTAAVTAAERLASSNIALQAEVRAQVAALIASRRAMLVAGDRERRQLEERLRSGAEARLHLLSDVLDTSELSAWEDPGGHAARARAQLALTLTELNDLAHGLHPRILAARGLSGALLSLDSGSAPFDLQVKMPDQALPDVIALSAWFVCVEAVANAAKHAQASHVTISGGLVAERLLLTIQDDGIGGAQSGGLGLQGLADRVESLGGHLRIVSPPGSGTVVTVELPLDR